LSDPDLDKRRPLFKGVDTVVHLAFNHREGPREDSYVAERTNVDMAYNVYRLLQQEGGRRVVMASSNHAADFYEHPIWRRQLDRTQLFVRSIEAEEIRNEWGVPFQVFYGISGNTRTFWSIASARRVIGYEPEDDSEIVYADDIHRHLKRSPFAGPVVEGKNRRG